MRLYNQTRRFGLGSAKRAAGFFDRLRGLIGRDPENFGEALWIVPCCGIHTFGMRRPLDIVFLNRDKQVIKMAINVRPFSPGVVCPGAYSVLEFFSGAWDPSQLAVGDRLAILDEVEK